DPRIGWFQNMPGASSLLFHVEQGGFDQFDDGTAHFYGTVSNVNNDQLAWEFDIWMRGGYSWDDWHALGRGYKNQGIAGNHYLDWTYYEMDDSKDNTFTGIRAYDGSHLTLTHNPSNYYYGFQVGENANVFTYTYGMSGWFTYYGVIKYNGHSYNRNGVNSDFNLNLGCTSNNSSCGVTIIRTTTATDACGNQATVTQKITREPDNISPSISPLQDKSYSCNEDVSWDVPVAQDNCGTPELIEGLEIRSEMECGYQMSKSWYAVDACGNQSDIVTQTITVVDDVAPVFVGNTQDIQVSCGESMPDFTPLTAIDNCDPDVKVVYTDSVINENGKHCDVVNMEWSNESDPRIGWFQNMPGASSLLFHVEQGGFDQFDDGTAHFYGTVSNVNNDQLAWEFDIWMRGGYNWDDWHALGRGYKNQGIAGNHYLDWTYYGMDDSKDNTFTGIRAYEGSHLTLTHNPSNYYYGFQVGENANVFTYTYGMSGWFTYYGVIKYNGHSYDRNGVNSDFNLNLGCTESATSCGVTVYRTTTATDKCGNQASVTQKISVEADHVPPVVVNPPAPECSIPLTFEEFFNTNWSLTATDNCSPDITIDLPEIAWDCNEGKYTLNYVFTDNCGNSTTYTRDVCIAASNPSCSIVVPNEISSQGNNTFVADIVGGMAPYHFSWTILSGNWDFSTATDESSVQVATGTGQLVLQLTVTDQNGCSTICTVEAEPPSSDLAGGCTLTQGFYGNDRGRYCDGRKTSPLIADLMASGSIVLGKPGKSFTLTENDVDCIIGLLGGGGPSESLDPGNGSCGDFNFSTKTKRGATTSRNTLVSQAITLALNMRLDGDLGAMQIMGNCMTTASSSDCGTNGSAYAIPGTERNYCFSPSILQKLGTGFTISELFDLASRALGGENVGVSLGDITDALGFINDGFDECRIVTQWSTTNSISAPQGEELTETQGEINRPEGKVTAYPNPTVNLVKLAFEIPISSEEGTIQIVNGQGIPVYKQTMAMQKGSKEIQIDTEGWTPGPYYVIIRVNAYIMYGQFIRIE
ncbi:MAG: T9SS type A sorting domain-containing protein, partial [Saprospiraceae bacterium]|nr:T9SS type A sorting domain-containing protein [Saprospiraceae bacterium]